jgi:lipopolysaccharide transport system ATP-binding protein
VGNIVISCEHLSKTYHLGQIGSGTLTDDLKIWWAKTRGKPNPLLKIGEVDQGNRYGEELWALRDVSFTVEQGEVLGIIGRNGAGKSTLLKILSRVTAPTSGRIRVKGRVASLLEVGTGFHPDLTGRENTYLNGAILGMSRKEVTRKFDEIVDFSEVQKFIDTPVKRYSSGMYVRLAFAVAAHMDPEILVVDEVLAVGDAEFQKKCLGKMGDVARKGRTVLFVSHNMVAVHGLCEKVAHIDHGTILEIGSPDEVIGDYLSSSVKNDGEIHELTEIPDRIGNGPLKFTSWWIKDEKLAKKNTIICGDKVSVFLKYRTESMDRSRIKDVSLTLVVNDLYGRPILGGSTYYSDSNFTHVPEMGVFECDLGNLMLMPGTYRLHIRIAVRGEESDSIENAGSFDVIQSDIFGSGRFPDHKHGIILITPKWKVY